MTNRSLTLMLKTMPVLESFNTVLTQLRMPPRFRSAVLDHLGMTVILGLMMIPIFIYVVYETVETGKQVFLERKLWALIYGGFLGSLYLNKDAVLGQGVGKRICGVQVIDRKTMKAAGSFRCLIRNLTFIMWPVEVLVLLVTRNRRLGDFITNTEVVQYKEKTSEKFSQLQLLSSLLLGTILCFIYYQLYYS